MTRIEMEMVELGVPSSGLKELHQEIDALSSLSNFAKGWEVANNGNSKAKKRLYGTLATIVTLATETYGGCSIYFGSIAFQQGLKDLEESGKASIIGHWSEWTNQGLLVMNLPIMGPYREMTAVGNRKQVEEIFKAYLSNAETGKQQRAVYEDYLECMPFLNQSNFLWTVHLPSGLPKQIDTKMERNHPLYKDYYLQHVYSNIETEWQETGKWTNFRKGCGVVSDYYGGARTWGIRVAVGLGALYSLPSLIAYGAGIWFSADEALIEREAGNIPSIGGHCLEWGVEAYTILKGAVGYFREIRRVGEAQNLVNIFNEKIELAEDGKYLSREEKVERLEWVKRWTVRQFPGGNFYNLPSAHMYPNE